MYSYNISIGETFKRHPAAGRLKGTQVKNATIVLIYVRNSTITSYYMTKQ